MISFLFWNIAGKPLKATVAISLPPTSDYIQD